eukprot:gene1647-1799_t
MILALQKKKKELKNELGQIERQIYDLETSYLEETKEFGNIFSGWDGYLSSDKTKVKKQIQNEDRHFSLSSVTSPASRKEEHKKRKATGGDSTVLKKKKKEKNEADEAVPPEPTESTVGKEVTVPVKEEEPVVGLNQQEVVEAVEATAEAKEESDVYITDIPDNN